MGGGERENSLSLSLNLQGTLEFTKWDVALQLRRRPMYLPGILVVMDVDDASLEFGVVRGTNGSLCFLGGLE